MSTFPGSPQLVKGGIVLIDPDTAMVKRIITLQYNPDTLSRTLQVQGSSGEGNSRSQPLRLTGPPIEIIKLEAEIDATDKMETDDSNTAQYGIHAQLAALETVIYPTSSQLILNNNASKIGSLEIASMQSDLALFIWSKNRIIPVRFTDFSITEEAFDTNLNPIRAKISLGMRVLSIDDLGFDQKGGSLFMSYLRNKEKLAGMYAQGNLKNFGINSIL